jgi:Arc/MetJ family transcription regulator
MSRIVIDIEDDLLNKAQQLTGINNTSEIVEYALRSVIRQKGPETVCTLSKP